MATTTEKLVLSVKETSELLGLSLSNTYDLVADGWIKSIRLRGRILIPRNAVEEMLARAQGRPEGQGQTEAQ